MQLSLSGLTVIVSNVQCVCTIPPVQCHSACPACLISLWLSPMSVHISLSSLTVIASNCFYNCLVLHSLHLYTDFSLSGLTMIMSTVCTSQSVLSHCHCGKALYTSAGLSHCPMSVHLTLAGVTVIVSTVCTSQPALSHCHCVECVYNLSLSCLTVIVAKFGTPQPVCLTVQCLHLSLAVVTVIVSTVCTSQAALSHCHCVECVYNLRLPCLTVIVSNVCTISGCLVSLSLCRMCVQSQSVLSHCHCGKVRYTSACLSHCPMSTPELSWCHCHCVHCLYISAFLVSLSLCRMCVQSQSV